MTSLRFEKCYLHKKPKQLFLTEYQNTAYEVISGKFLRISNSALIMLLSTQKYLSENKQLLFSSRKKQ